MLYNTLKLETDTGISTLTLNRPEKRNALSPEMISELLAALDELEKSPARVVILTGAGKAFCAGMDLTALKAMAGEASTEGAQERALENSRVIARLFQSIYKFPKPLIAAVNGAAVAGGCGIATLSDFTLAVPEAKFGYTEVKIGFVPAIVSAFLVRQVGEKVARDLLLTGRVFDAREAYELGLVNEVTEPEGLLEHGRAVALRLAEASPASLASTKRLLAEFTRLDLERELDIAIQESARIRTSGDFKEGVTAFLERRKPRWQGE